MLACLSLVLAAIACIAYAFYKWAIANNNYFQLRNVKYMEPKFFVGNSDATLSKKFTAAEYAQWIYNAFPNESIFGMFDFREPLFIIRDPEIIKRVGVKDFDHFEDHRSFTDSDTDVLWGNNLIQMKGEKWRHMRATLSPAFTGSKMRQMFDLVLEVVDDIVKHFEQQTASEQQINIEMKDFFSRYSNDVIASCAFGLKVNSIANPTNEFYTNGQKAMDFSSFVAVMRIMFIVKMPWLARLLNIQFLDASVVQSFRSIVLNTMATRKKENIFRPDMINILMQVRDGSLNRQNDDNTNNLRDGFATVEESNVGKMIVNRKWTDDELVAQCYLFFLAGFETSSTVLTFISYELVVNPDLQQRLYEEIVAANDGLNGGRVSYEVLQKMTYLDQFISETLRKWPVGVQVDRACVKDYAYDDGRTKFVIEKGSTVAFTIYGIHRDPKYYPEPEKFDPERFSEENKHKIIPGTYLPFGVGPRNCIGSRFALMELKAIIYHLLLRFSFEPNEKTNIPIKLSKIIFTLQVEDGMHVQLKPRH